MSTDSWYRTIPRTLPFSSAERRKVRIDAIHIARAMKAHALEPPAGQKVSIVITNFNYARYVDKAVESALALNWENFEVIVVDDGSTDQSLEVLRRYADDIQLIAGANQGQREAANTGFRSSSGDVVIFLDADDVLDADAARAVLPHFATGVAKVQFRMQRIDSAGIPFGTPIPRYRRIPRPEQIRRWMIDSTAYPTPPGSGNAYSRHFLERVMPLGPDIGGFADSGLLALAPLLGDVVALNAELVQYRRHETNDSNLVEAPDRFYRECSRALDRWNFARKKADLDPDPCRVFRSREVLQFRTAASRLTPSRKLPMDSRRRIVADIFRSVWISGPESTSRKLLIAAWCLAMIIAPARTVPRLVRTRFGRS